MTTERTRPPELSESSRPRPGAVLAVGALISVGFMGSVVVTPLYSLYQREFGFSEITLTLVYAVYVVGNVAALLLFGQISDQAGRKRAAFAALALAAVGALLFLFAGGTLSLYLGRLLIGFAVGVASGTGTAWLAEQYGPGRRPTATLAAATANLTGIALGPLLAGLLAQYAPWPLRLPFLTYLAALALVAAALARTAETRPPRVGGLGDLRFQPRLGVPGELIGAFTAPAITGFVTFALGGLYFALIPGIVLRDLHSNVAVGGLVVCELATVATAVLVLGRRLRPALAMTCGLVLLVPAVALVVTAQALRSMPLLLVATALAGVTMALGYRGSLQVVNDIAPDDRRAEVVSSYFIACFIGNSIPVIGLGVLSTLTDPLLASIVFAGTIAVFSFGALLGRGRG